MLSQPQENRPVRGPQRAYVTDELTVSIDKINQIIIEVEEKESHHRVTVTVGTSPQNKSLMINAIDELTAPNEEKIGNMCSI